MGQNRGGGAKAGQGSAEVAPFVYIWHRTRLGAAADMEIDVEAAAEKEMWICESKWWKARKAGIKEVESLLFKAELLRKKEGEGLQTLRLWFFAHDGFTPEAEGLMTEKGVCGPTGPIWMSCFRMWG